MTSVMDIIRIVLFLVIIAVTDAKTFDDSILFRIDWRLQGAIPKHFLDVPDDWLSNSPYLHMTSDKDEKYFCTLPTVSAQSRKEVQSYTGPSPAELIQSLYDNRICSYWLDVYWTYELCHGRYVLQYHDDREAPRNTRMEYYLGNYRREQSKLDDKDYNEMKPPKRKMDNKEQPYYPVTYRHGTICDLTGKPRKTVVMYSCNQDAKDQIYSFTETASCSYEIIVLTKRLCSHPSFQPLPVVDNAVVCYAKDRHQGKAKPKQLIKLEKESQESFEMEYISAYPFYEHRENIEFDSNDDGEADELDLSLLAKKLKTAVTNAASPSGQFSVGSSTYRFENPTVDMDRILEENIFFLNGKQCLYGGGTGWWKYEFCYGKTVKQFHDTPEGQRIEILLGVFDQDVHKHWIDTNPLKKPLNIDGRIMQVSHIYTGGTLCKEADIHRSVEVRIRCKSSEKSQTALTIYLLEPHTCQYILGVESPRFCDLLQNVDQYGLFQLSEMKSKAEL